MRRRRLVAGGIVLATTWVACTFSTRLDAVGDAPPADASACTAAPTYECAGTMLRTCTMVGSDPDEKPCNWGCKPATAANDQAHCGEVMPKGGGATITDTRNFGGLDDIVISAPTTIDGSAGTIGGVTAGFDHEVRGSANKIAVFRMKSLTINAPVRLVGSAAIAFVSDGPIIVNAVIDAKGPCGVNTEAATPGPGGFAGGTAESVDGFGVGGGKAGVDSAGAGGGGHGGLGGAGGKRGPVDGGLGGGLSGDPEIMTLIGGGGGGSTGGAGGRGHGGGGGGAVQLVSNVKIVLMNVGGIDAGGCGGDSGQGMSTDAGGGGGAGGAILLEAPIIEGSAPLAVNGGGGGAGDDQAPAHDRGAKATLDRMFAAGALGNTSGAGGGSGAAAGVAVGTKGIDVGTHAGGGGGGIGRIRLNTRTGDVAANGVMSPALTGDPNSTCTAGPADVR